MSTSSRSSPRPPRTTVPKTNDASPDRRQWTNRKLIRELRNEIGLSPVLNAIIDEIERRFVRTSSKTDA